MSTNDNDTTVPIDKYREALSQSKMKDAEIEHLKESLHDAEYLLKRIQTEKASIDQAARDEAIDLVVSVSKGKVTKESLQDTPTETINRMAELAVKVASPSFVSVLRQAEKDAATPKTQGTVGGFNSSTGKYEGGIEA